MKRGFTLIEIIVVIIIVGILAAVGLSQYSRLVEKTRQAEVKMAFGVIRKVAYDYWLQNGSLSSAVNADVNIGAGADQLPEMPNCRSTHYYNYNLDGVSVNQVNMTARRCISGGKSPQYAPSYYIQCNSNFQTGTDTWYNNF